MAAVRHASFAIGLTDARDPDSFSSMSRPSTDTDRIPVSFLAVPGSRAWVAFCLGTGGLALSIGLGLALGERARTLQGPLVESVLTEITAPAGEAASSSP